MKNPCDPIIILASREIAVKRYEICKICPQFESTLARCKECGCFMKLKTKLKDSTCPINKW